MTEVAIASEPRTTGEVIAISTELASVFVKQHKEEGASKTHDPEANPDPLTPDPSDAMRCEPFL